ncbi:MAG: 16S rRNA (guanine(527)-N(7))-methyltransferase RsmG [Candidatus Babeliales bacterium]
MDLSQQDSNARAAVAKLSRTYALNDHQLDQFAKYLSMLQEWNKMMNLTAITDTQGIVSLHFDDSLQLSKAMDLSHVKMLADVGTGAGFPGLALKIMFPALPVLLIEVVQKKIEFLQAVVSACGLEGVEISGLDWRNFLRYPDYEIDLFVSRAALPTEELIRLFRPSCSYKNAQLVYWASKNWQASSPEEIDLKVKEFNYTVDGKSRKLVFFKRQDSSKDNYSLSSK